NPGTSPRAVAPVTLSYPYLTAAEARTDGYRQLADRVADSYVELTILAPGELAPGERPGIIHVASGIAVRPGLVLTAAHIARSTRPRAQVRTRDGRRLDARIVHLDPKRELALLAVDRGAGLVQATLGPDAPPAKGDFALAIGSPGG